MNHNLAVVLSAAPSSMSCFAIRPSMGNTTAYVTAFSELACRLAYRAAMPWVMTANCSSVERQ